MLSFPTFLFPAVPLMLNTVNRGQGWPTILWSTLGNFGILLQKFMSRQLETSAQVLICIWRVPRLSFRLSLVDSSSHARHCQATSCSRYLMTTGPIQFGFEPIRLLRLLSRWDVTIVLYKWMKVSTNKSLKFLFIKLSQVQAWFICSCLCWLNSTCVFRWTYTDEWKEHLAVSWILAIWLLVYTALQLCSIYDST